MRHKAPGSAVTSTLATNLMGRDFVVGDLSAHGDFAGIDRAMIDHGFDPKCDRLFCVGHIGVDATSAIDAKFVLRFLAQPHVFAVRGEREERLLALSERGALAGDGLVGLMSANHTPWFSEADAVDRARILERMSAMPLAIQTGCAPGCITGYVHAQVPEGLSWSSFMRSLNDTDGYATDMALFGRIRDGVPGDASAAVPGAETVFVGHATAYRAAACRPSNVRHVHTLRRSTCDPMERSTRAAVQSLSDRLQAFVHTLIEPQRVAMR